MKKKNEALTWAERSDRVIAQGCTTYSKRRDQYVEGVYPTHVVQTAYDGLGNKVECSDGKSYYDMGGLGSSINGCCGNFSLPSIMEVMFAEWLIKTLALPRITKCKILKTGSAACEMAVRFARAYTGRKMVLFEGYHGTHDTFIGQEAPGAGCLKMWSMKFDNIDGIIGHLETMGDDPPACVIVEPVVLDNGPKRIGSLRALRAMCRRMGVVYVHDEIVSGWRYLDYTVSKHHKITPDLICLGKAIGNGMAISVLAGRASILDNPDVFCSNTCNGEDVGLRIGLKTMTEITPGSIIDMWTIGRDVMNQFNKISPKLQLVGIPTRWTWKGDERIIAVFWQEMLGRGWLLGKSVFIKQSHGYPLMRWFLDDSRKVLKTIDTTPLRGKLPRPVFKRY